MAREEASRSKLARKQVEHNAKASEKAMKAAEKASVQKCENAIDISGKALTRLQGVRSKLEGLLFEDTTSQEVRKAVLAKRPEFIRTKALQSYVDIRTMTELALRCLSEATVEDIGYGLGDVHSGEKNATEYVKMLSSL